MRYHQILPPDNLCIDIYDRLYADLRRMTVLPGPDCELCALTADVHGGRLGPALDQDTQSHRFRL